MNSNIFSKVKIHDTVPKHPTNYNNDRLEILLNKDNYNYLKIRELDNDKIKIRDEIKNKIIKKSNLTEISKQILPFKSSSDKKKYKQKSNNVTRFLRYFMIKIIKNHKDHDKSVKQLVSETSSFIKNKYERSATSNINLSSFNTTLTISSPMISNQFYLTDRSHNSPKENKSLKFSNPLNSLASISDKIIKNKQELELKYKYKEIKKKRNIQTTEFKNNIVGNNKSVEKLSGCYNFSGKLNKNFIRNSDVRKIKFINLMTEKSDTLSYTLRNPLFNKFVRTDYHFSRNCDLNLSAKQTAFNKDKYSSIGSRLFTTRLSKISFYSKEEFNKINSINIKRCFEGKLKKEVHTIENLKKSYEGLN